MQNAISVKGIGVVSAAGISLDDNWKKLMKGETSISSITGINTEGLISKNEAQIKFTDEELREILFKKVNIKSDKKLPMERAELLFFIAFIEAIEDAGITLDELKGKKCAILAGTSLSGFTLLEKDYTDYFYNKKHINEKSFLVYPLHTCIDRLAYEFNISGIRCLFSTACSASLHPFVMAQSLFEKKEINFAIVGGMDPLSLMSLAGFSSLKSLAKEHCTPFSVGDYGISIGEGAGVILLGEGISKYDSMIGIAGTSDAYHPTASNPTGEAIGKCIRKSLENIDVRNSDIAIMSHGTGTPHNDTVEMRALKQIDELKESKIMATKSVIGHTLGASGVIESIFLLKCMKEKILIPIANFTEPRNQDSLKLVTNKSEQISDCIGLKSAFAFGGNNVTVVFGNNEKYRKCNVKKDTDDIVISGMGIVSPYDVYTNNELYEKISTTKNCFKNIEKLFGFNGKEYTEMAGIVNEDKLNEQCLKMRYKNTRKMDKISKMASVACSLAIKDSALKITSENTDRIGLISATGTGPLSSVSKFYEKLLQNGVKSADANIFPNTVVNAHLGYASIELKIKGYSTVIAHGVTSSYSAIKLAMNLLESNICEAVVVGGVSEYSDNYQKALLDVGYSENAKEQNSLNEENKGNIIGEGAVYFVLEKRNNAISRDASIKSVLKVVDTNSLPCFPSTFNMKGNPLFTLLKKYDWDKNKIYFAGEGNSLLQEKRLESSAVKSIFGNIDATSAASYFGYASSITPLYNLALFNLFSEKEQIAGIKNKTYGFFGLNVVSGIKKTEKKAILIGSIAPGGEAGIILAEKK